ncbi:MAG: PrsW family intramembrane metalloprotease [Ruminococcus sp.]|nr:PrsW family intramembrane metalloprotease [Ruminococcus sp.]
MAGALSIYNIILIAAAVIPAVFLMIKVYRSDRLESESPRLLWSLVIAGILSSLLALVEEKIGGGILSLFVSEKSRLYDVLLYFVVVAVSEESSKYLLLKRHTWTHQEFNCQYDGVVYAVFVSLGFALWENISYVTSFGFSAALIRAVTAVPGHACFGVFMGVFYGLAKKCSNRGDLAGEKLFRRLSVIVPVLLHGAYDYIATMNNVPSGWYFAGFVGALFIVSYFLVGRMSKKDSYI